MTQGSLKASRSEGEHRADVRNVALIAHVDHGKTTLVDAMLKDTGSFDVRAGAVQTQVLDSNAIEQERGITILAKNTSVLFNGVTINIVDTPGHADFGSEVERILRMVDGALLLVDAVEGPMPQTRFVLRKTLDLGLRPIVVINKMDRPHARPHEALDKVFSLFVDLGATDAQAEFPVVYACARSGWTSMTVSPGTDTKPLFETIVKHVPGPAADTSRSLQMMVTMLDYSNYLGLIGVGRIQNGRLRKSEMVSRVRADGSVSRHKITQIQRHFGLSKREVPEALAGDIVLLAGIEDIEIGQTVADGTSPQALAPLVIEPPTLSMEFQVNDSPFAGLEGEFVTGRHLNARLLDEQKTNVGLKIESLEREGSFKVSGRGELHLAILIENMRREGYELAVSRPEVICKEVDGIVHEPVEHLVLDVPAGQQGVVLEALGKRGGKMINMAPEGVKRIRFEFLVPSARLLGFKQELLVLTRGTGLMHHSFHGYAPKGADAAHRSTGVLVSMERGRTTAYAFANLQDRGSLFIGAGVEVYTGMIVGRSSRAQDINVNACKAKGLSNMRSKASDDSCDLTPAEVLTLEQAIEFIDETELVEVTPKSLRLRKKTLNPSIRRRIEKDKAWENQENS